MIEFIVQRYTICWKEIKFLYFTNCNIEDACSTKEPFQRGFTIDISGREMTGTTLPLSDVEDGFIWTFEAVKE